MDNPEKFEKIGLNETDWQIVRIDDPRHIDGVPVVGLKAHISEYDLAGEIWSRGQFYFNDQEIYRAWGRKNEPHCSYHHVSAEPHTIYEGCPQVKIESNSDGKKSILVTTPIKTYRYDSQS